MLLALGGRVVMQTAKKNMFFLIFQIDR